VSIVRRVAIDGPLGKNHADFASSRSGRARTRFDDFFLRDVSIGDGLLCRTERADAPDVSGVDEASFRDPFDVMTAHDVNHHHVDGPQGRDEDLIDLRQTVSPSIGRSWRPGAISPSTPNGGGISQN